MVLRHSKCRYGLQFAPYSTSWERVREIPSRRAEGSSRCFGREVKIDSAAPKEKKNTGSADSMVSHRAELSLQSGIPSDRPKMCWMVLLRGVTCVTDHLSSLQHLCREGEEEERSSAGRLHGAPPFAWILDES